MVPMAIRAALEPGRPYLESTLKARERYTATYTISMIRQDFEP
jgi:hypothetical protein